jgi:hypothetical protein
VVRGFGLVTYAYTLILFDIHFHIEDLIFDRETGVERFFEYNCIFKDRMWLTNSKEGLWLSGKTAANFASSARKMGP